MKRTFIRVARLYLVACFRLGWWLYLASVRARARRLPCLGFELSRAGRALWDHETAAYLRLLRWAWGLPR